MPRRGQVATLSIPSIGEEWSFDLDELYWLSGHLPRGDEFTRQIEEAIAKLEEKATDAGSRI